MLNVSFHIQADNDVLLPEHFMADIACRYVEQGYKVCIMCIDTSHATNISKHLWSFPPNSFIPHKIKDHMVITEGPFQKKCIINMSHECILNMKVMIIELVVQGENNKLNARNRFKIYKEHGFALKHVKETCIEMK